MRSIHSRYYHLIKVIWLTTSGLFSPKKWLLSNKDAECLYQNDFHYEHTAQLEGYKITTFIRSTTGELLFIPDLAVEEVSHVFRAAYY